MSSKIKSFLISILDNLFVRKLQYTEILIFRLFPIISISQKFFSFFSLTLEKIGIDEKVICYHNILGLMASTLQTFFSFFFLTLEQFFLTVR